MGIDDHPQADGAGGGARRVSFGTDRAWEDTCRQLILRIADVTDPVAWFRFR
jgi:hypothetical protein